MKKAMVSSLAVFAIATGVAASPLVTSASTVNENIGSIIKSHGFGDTTIDKNVGSIIKTDGSASSVTGNVGAIIKIDGKGQDVNKVLKDVDISRNVGSIIKISNVCGAIKDSSKINNNVGTIIKIDGLKDDCDTTPGTPENPKTPEVPKTPKTPETPKVPETPKTPENSEMPLELPRTGMGSSALVASIFSVLAAAATYVIRRG